MDANPDPILDCQWHDPQGDWHLSVIRNGSAWELFAAAPVHSETIPFDGPDDVRRLAQALLDLPAEPEPYEFEWHLSRLSRSEDARSGDAQSGAGDRDSGGDGAGDGPTVFATFTVGLDPADGHRPYLAYQSYYHRGHSTALGLEVICEDPPIDRLQAQAHALLTSLPQPHPLPPHHARRTTP